MTPGERQILACFKAGLAEVFGDRIERIILFGSRARQEARPESDYDIALFLHDMESFSAEADRLAKLEFDLMQQTGAVINTLPFKAGAYASQTSFMEEVRRDGRTI